MMQQNLTGSTGIISQNNAQYTGSLASQSMDIYLNKNDEVRLGFGYYNGEGFDATTSTWDASHILVRSVPSGGGTTNCDYQLELWGNSTGQFSSANGTVGVELIDPDIPAYACTYNLQDVLPDTQKQLDFIKGVAHSFNLQFNTNESTKTVEIEPYTSFYLPPKDAVDWTWKLDRSRDIVDSFIENNFTRRLVFKYKTDDKDSRIEHMGDTYFDGVHDMYPYRQELGTQYPVGDTVFENPFFAGTYEGGNPYLGHVYQTLQGTSIPLY
ncbi:MAG TPA: hypothetical protein EYO58_09125 [Flavobacteriales bacterium]|nr:hypothetical protein [Flavobacteriales bacterium]